jgi:hypothetical protein
MGMEVGWCLLTKKETEVKNLVRPSFRKSFLFSLSPLPDEKATGNLLVYGTTLIHVHRAEQKTSQQFVECTSYLFQHHHHQ